MILGYYDLVLESFKQTYTSSEMLISVLSFSVDIIISVLDRRVIINNAQNVSLHVLVSPRVSCKEGSKAAGVCQAAPIL